MKKKREETNSTGALFENRPSLYFCNNKENKYKNASKLDTLFIDDFIDIMEQYFFIKNITGNVKN